MQAAHLDTGTRSDEGFTVVEAVAAAAIMLFVMAAVAGALTFTSRSSVMSDKRERGLNLANERIERARNLPYDSVGVQYAGGGYGDPPGSIVTPEDVGDYTVATTVGWERDPDTGRAIYKSLTVRVSWEEPTAGSVSASSILYGKSLLVNVGDVEVTVLDRDTGDPLSGAAVGITPSSGPSRGKNTDGDGVAFFGQVPAGAVGILASKAGWLMDLSPVAGAVVNPELLNSFVIQAQRPSQAVVTVRNSSGAALSGATVRITDSSGTRYTDTTDGAGEARFGDLFTGAYEVEAYASGYSAGTSSFVISTAGSTGECEIVLADPASLRVRVRDAAGETIRDATVVVTGPSPSTDQVPGSPGTTTDSGEASFVDLVAGTYTVVVSKSGYDPATVGATVVAGVEGDVDVTLQPVQQGELLIRTVNRWGWPDGHVRVDVQGPNGFYRDDVWTDHDGTVLLSGLVPGQYQVRDHGRLPWVSTTVSAGMRSEVQVTNR